MIALDPLRCLLTDHTQSGCEACLQACAQEAFTLRRNNRLALDPERCNGCGGCIGGCPSEALSLEGFDENHFTLLFIQSQQTTLSCRHNTPCLAAFSPEHLVVMALRKERPFSCDLASCEGCSSDPEGHLLKLIHSRIEVANDLLKQLDHPHLIATEASRQASDRRSFFTKLLHRAAQSRVTPEQPLKSVSHHKTPTPKRQLLLANTLKPYQKSHPEATSPLFGHIELNQEACTGCQECARFCPTGALLMQNPQGHLQLTPESCVRCTICSLVCQEKAITAKRSATLESWQQPRTLAAFEWRNCAQCGTFFAAKADQTHCRPCGEFVVEFGDMFTQERNRKAREPR